eukprot:s2397_g6.t1
MDKPPTNMTAGKNVVLPNVAKKLVRNAAVLGCMLISPVLGLFSQMQDRPDFLEIACAANSLAGSMTDLGYHAKRVNYLTGYDLSSKKGASMLKQEIALHPPPPRFSWVSLPCTRLPSLVNLTQKSEWASFLKRQRQDFERASEVADACEPILQNGDDVAWEWPATATPGWKAHAIKKLLHLTDVQVQSHLILAPF